QAKEFAGTATKCRVKLGPITALRRMPEEIIHGPFNEEDNEDEDVVKEQLLARSTELSVGKGHVNGLSIQYLLGPSSSNSNPPYPDRLVAFWSTQGAP